LSEIEEIERISKSKKVEVEKYTDTQATESQFYNLSYNNPDVMYIATHGFYFGEDEKSRETANFIDDKAKKFAESSNPLQRSGFVLSSGNALFSGKQIKDSSKDGILTASEISSVGFFGTKLVVLSACQTGLGEVKGSEGVYGLQRAFKMAGVEYLIYSLWEVPDQTTKELMSKFYENWASGKEVRIAFKEAQNYLKDKYKEYPGSSFAWAAFVLMN